MLLFFVFVFVLFCFFWFFLMFFCRSEVEWRPLMPNFWMWTLSYGVPMVFSENSKALATSSPNDWVSLFSIYSLSILFLQNCENSKGSVFFMFTIVYTDGKTDWVFYFSPYNETINLYFTGKILKYFVRFFPWYKLYSLTSLFAKIITK